MAVRLRNNVCKLRKFVLPNFRTFLSAAYRCEDAWSNRLKCPLVAGINSSDYIYDLDRKFKNEGKISAIDVDLLVNKLEPTEAKNINQDLEEVVQRLRRSPETIHTLPSTSHAVLRMLLDSRRTKLMLKLLSNPLEFGVFPDHYMSNLLMDTFIEEKNYTAAARVASVLMLQEDFGPPLTQALAMASCYLYATSTENLPWEDYTVKIEEPEEELKIRIPYLRNPYFDDHFDLKEPNHIVGKTLAWGAPLIGGEIGTNCEILGWALYNKWSDLEAALQRCTANSSPVAASVITSVKELVTSSDDSENQEKIMSLVTRLESSGTCIKEVNLKSVIEDHVKNVAAKAEADDIKVQEGLYATWEKMRQEEVEKQLEEYRRKQLLEEIERKKNELKTKEELFTFFENQDRLEMLLDRKPVVREKDRTHFFPHKIKKPKKVDEDYIPPEVIRR
ncbi:small ribosomal subunit protein mS27 [Macrobrachium rosenbergii]|uniref:small ribosomal subunit protein mS27 n=1 Tax=Macrobrachium rosenbergii TaxID=79674 RepID=UPI0034D5FC72